MSDGPQQAYMRNPGGLSEALPRGQVKGMPQTKPGAQELQGLKFKEDITLLKVGLSRQSWKTGTSLGVPGLGFCSPLQEARCLSPGWRNKDLPCQDLGARKKKKKTKDPEL